MKNFLPLVFLFCASDVFAQQKAESFFYGQQHIDYQQILDGKIQFMDSTEQLRAKTIEEKYSQLLNKEKRIAERIDSLRQHIKSEKDELLKARLDIILLLIKNDKTGDVYEKMREFGDKTILEINKRIATPAWFYDLDKEYATAGQERKDVENSARSMSMDYFIDNKIARAKLAAHSQLTPYDSLKAETKLKTGGGVAPDFLAQLCKIYREPVTNETDVTADYSLERIIICGEKPEMFERKIWTWGGVFCFYNGDNPIKEEDYIANSRASIQKALKYHEQNQPDEK